MLKKVRFLVTIDQEMFEWLNKKAVVEISYRRKESISRNQIVVEALSNLKNMIEKKED